MVLQSTRHGGTEGDGRSTFPCHKGIKNRLHAQYLVTLLVAVVVGKVRKERGNGGVFFTCDGRGGACPRLLPCAVVTSVRGRDLTYTTSRCGWAARMAHRTATSGNDSKVRPDLWPAVSKSSPQYQKRHTTARQQITEIKDKARQGGKYHN